MELPRSTVYGRIIAKDKLFDYGDANRNLQDVIARQVGRIRWANKIAPGTMSLIPDEDVLEIELIEIELRLPLADLDRRILPLIAKAIPYQLLFMLVEGEKNDYAVVYGGKVYHNETAPKIIGNNTKLVWENLVRQIVGLPIDNTDLGEAVSARERLTKLKKRIESLEAKARSERQPRRKLEYANEIKRLKELL